MGVGIKALTKGAILRVLLLAVLSAAAFLHYQPNAEAETLIRTDSKEVRVTVPDTTVTVSGCVAPYSLVTLFRNNVAAGTTAVPTSGQYSKSIVFETEGLHNIKAFAEDIDGNISSTVSKNINVVIHSDTPLSVVLPPIVTINKTVFSLGEQLIFTGSTCPNSEISLIINDNIRIEAISDENGRWFAIVSSVGFNVGEHSFNVISTVLGVEIASQTQVFRVIEEGARAGGLGPIDVGSLVPPTIVQPDDNYLSSGPQVTLKGTGEPNVQLEVLRDGELVGSLFTNPLGEWTFIMTMTKPQHSVHVRLCYADVCGDLSNEVTVFYQGDYFNCDLKYELKNYRFHSTRPRTGIDLELIDVAGDEPYTIIIDWGDDQVDNLTHYSSESISYHHVYHYIGHYNGIITIEDSDGCQQTQYFSVEVTPVGFNWNIIWWMLLIFIFSTYIYYTRIEKKIHEKRQEELEGKLKEAEGIIATDVQIARIEEEISHDVEEIVVEKSPKAKPKAKPKATSKKKTRKTSNKTSKKSPAKKTVKRKSK